MSDEESRCQLSVNGLLQHPPSRLSSLIPLPSSLRCVARLLKRGVTSLIARIFLKSTHDSTMKIALASDHAGYAEKERLKPLLQELGIEFDDLGTGSEESVDYPDYARKVGERVASGEAEQGLLVCGSGTGMAIAANKV